MAFDHPQFMASLPSTLADRMLYCSTASVKPGRSFVLYLPTVVLRQRHNPGFALACRLANQLQCNVLVLCTVLDDEHLEPGRSHVGGKAICHTARRYAFILEALQSCCRQWEEHGAGVAIRVHGPGARTPDHLKLVYKAAAVVADEPFVAPFRTCVQRVAKACIGADVAMWTVDGSTTVPPRIKLQFVKQKDGVMYFNGVPKKAWMWEKNTNAGRRSQVYSAVRDRSLDAPILEIKLPKGFFLLSREHSDPICTTILDAIPPNWRRVENIAPSKRPWTADELLATVPKEWVMTVGKEYGVDTSVPPSPQTHGSEACAKKRWKDFLQYHLQNYAKRRNQIVLVHAVSRASCYLNLGILSIFDVISQVWDAKANRTGLAVGCDKFLEEAVKWREHGYAHSFATPLYHRSQILPEWSVSFLSGKQKKLSRPSHADGHGSTTSVPVGPAAVSLYEQLESATSADATWNAMQSYLIETGELHNNARMTWGKTAVHWMADVPGNSADAILFQMCCLNDRFALDGLSPPSYSGILWCFGWGDKPDRDGRSISTKWSHRYRTGAEGFEDAKQHLFETDSASSGMVAQSSASTKQHQAKRARTGDVSRAASCTKPITSFFQSKSSK